MAEIDKTKYVQKFRKEWLGFPQFKDWLLEIPGHPTRARCNYCKSEFTAKMSDIRNHLSSSKHVKAAQPFSAGRSLVQTKINFTVKDLQSMEAEAKLSLYVCAHSAILPIDHLSELCKSTFQDQTAKSLKLHRTKCSGIIKNVFYQHFQKDLLQSVVNGFSKYSLLLDESNDISVVKLLGIAIVYHDDRLFKRVSTFLALVELNNCDAESISTAVKTTLANFKLPLNNLAGIGTDNASVMVGINNSVYTHLKSEVPNLILIKCVCHSLQLAVSHAARETFPRNLEFMISETYNWFSKSANRQNNYKYLFNAINDGADPKKIVRSCSTRWLSIEVAITRILDQYLELKTHFEITRMSEKCYTAELLYQMFKDEVNLAYLLFLKPILTDVQRVNKSFESNNVDPTLLLNDLSMLIFNIGNKIFLPNWKAENVEKDIQKYLNPKPYLGFQFNKKIDELIENKSITVAEEKTIRERCRDFLIDLYRQLKQRLPDNIKHLEKISLISVQNVLKQQKDQEKLISLLENLNIPQKTIGLIEQQYSSINFVRWENTTDTVKFWSEVWRYRDASGENPFKEICEFALGVLILPFSNADVERVFSTLNIVKNKFRNKMSTIMVNAILSVRYGLKRYDKCCKDYVLPQDIINKIGTKECYGDENVIDFELDVEF